MHKLNKNYITIIITKKLRLEKLPAYFFQKQKPFIVCLVFQLFLSTKGLTRTLSSEYKRLVILLTYLLSLRYRGIFNKEFYNESLYRYFCIDLSKRRLIYRISFSTFWQHPSCRNLRRGVYNLTFSLKTCLNNPFIGDELIIHNPYS